MISWVRCGQAGSLAVPLRFGLRWQFSSSPLVPTLLGLLSTFTLIHFPLLFPTAVPLYPNIYLLVVPPAFLPSHLKPSRPPAARPRGPNPAWQLPPQPQPSRSPRARATTPSVVRPRASQFPLPSAPSEPPCPPWPASMQVSIACTEQNLRSRSSEDRLCGPRSGPGGGNGGPVCGGHGNPPWGGGSGPKAQAAVVPRPPAPAGAFRESTGRGTGMKYRYGGGPAARPICSLSLTPEAS